MSDMDHLIIMRPYPNGKYQYVIYHKDSIPALRDCCLVSCTFDIFQPDTFNILEPDGLVVVYKLLMSTTPNNITWIDEFTGYNINNIIHIESNPHYIELCYILYIKCASGRRLAPAPPRPLA